MSQKGKIMVTNANRAKRNTAVVAVTIIIVMGIAAFFYIRGKSQKLAKEELLTLREKITLGDSKEKVKRTINEAQTSRLEYLFLGDNKSQRWVIKTPLEFGATNWVMLVEFSNSNVSAVRIRTEDSDKIKPTDALADKENKPN